MLQQQLVVEQFQVAQSIFVDGKAEGAGLEIDSCPGSQVRILDRVAEAFAPLLGGPAKLYLIDSPVARFIGDHEPHADWSCEAAVASSFRVTRLARWG